MTPANENQPKTTNKCPICGKPSEAAYRPFCSKRCADVDLQRWLSGRYTIPVVDDDKGFGDGSEEGGAER